MTLFREGRPARRRERRVAVPDGLWLKCESCAEILYRTQLEKNFWICPKCSFHFRIGCRQYVLLLLDEGRLTNFDPELESGNPLGFPGYREKLKEAQARTGLVEGLLVGEGKVEGLPIVFLATEFDFMGGSMGSVVGERVARAIRHARTTRRTLVILTASGGGARMQEGILSLMQMAKTTSELALLSEARVPYVTILTHPTMAGVMASFASLGDVILAEPGALLGFTGPRVIEQTIGEKLPAGFQRSEFLLAHGLVDMVVGRKELKSTLARILRCLAPADVPA